MWKWWCLCCALLHLCVTVSSQKTALDSPLNMMIFRFLRNLAFDVFGRTGSEDGPYIEIARKANKAQAIIPDNISFPCNVTGGRSQEVPDSVHKLRPGDIDVIGAMGDSLTAGAGLFAENILQIAVENRGASATGGGQGTWRQYLTIPNIIKEFNPNLIGYASMDSLTSHEASNLNIAESAAISQDMPYMAEVLVKRIKSNPKINLKKDWKFISLMIGPNNFCGDICWFQPSTWLLEVHKADILQVLRTLRDNLPRTFVALVPPPNLKALVDSSRSIVDTTSLICYFLRKNVCPCLYSIQFENLREEYYDVMKRWQDLEMEIATYPEFNRTDFAVVAQPVLTDIDVPYISDGYSDPTYFSADCFHLNQKSHALYANGLWNNLMEPYGAKSTSSFKMLEKFICPTSERPYLATMMN